MVHLSKTSKFRRSLKAKEILPKRSCFETNIFPTYPKNLSGNKASGEREFQASRPSSSTSKVRVAFGGMIPG